jgi:hypothetical protein
MCLAAVSAAAGWAMKIDFVVDRVEANKREWVEFGFTERDTLPR